MAPSSAPETPGFGAPSGIAGYRLWVPKTCGCQKPHPAHRPGTMYQKERRYCRATYVPHSVAPAVRQHPDGDLEILVSKSNWGFRHPQVGAPIFLGVVLGRHAIYFKGGALPATQNQKMGRFSQ
jgi:hypothetical protein